MRSAMSKDDNSGDFIKGALDIFGVKVDLAKVLSSSQDVTTQLEELRNKLKKAGGREVLSDEEWRSGRISGHLRTGGVFGKREYHLGTVGARGRRPRQVAEAPPAATVEPPTDVFEDNGEVTVIAEVPGAQLSDFEIKVQNGTLLFETKPEALRGFRKEISLKCRVDPGSLKAVCRNGILEIHLRKAAS